MSNFKVVFRADQTDKTEFTPHWTPGCPVLVEAIQVSRNTETAEAFLQLKLKNVSNKVVDAFDCSVEVLYDDGVAEEVSVSCLDADIPAGKDMSPKAVRLKQNTPERLTATILEVKQGNSLWDPTQAPPEPASVALSLSEKALKERERVLIKEGELKKPASSLKDAVADVGDFWICSCGQPNVGRSRCCSCNVSKELLLAWEDEGALEKAADERAKQAAKEEERRAHMKATILKRVKVGGIAVAAIVAVLLIATRWAIPTFKYFQASSLADNATSQEDYQAAWNALESMDGYGDSKEKAIQVAESGANTALENGDYEAAVYWFDLIGSQEEANEARYAYVKSHLNSEDMITWEYLETLSQQKYLDAQDISRDLYAWRFEFALVSGEDFRSNGQEWTKSDSTHSRTDSANLLIKPIAGPPQGQVTLRVDIEEIDGKTQINHTGKWHKADTKSVSFRRQDNQSCDMEKGFEFVSLGNGLYDDAWRATVTNTTTNEVIFVGEIRKEG